MTVLFERVAQKNRGVEEKQVSKSRSHNIYRRGRVIHSLSWWTHATESWADESAEPQDRSWRPVLMPLKHISWVSGLCARQSFHPLSFPEENQLLFLSFISFFPFLPYYSARVVLHPLLFLAQHPGIERKVSSRPEIPEWMEVTIRNESDPGRRSPWKNSRFVWVFRIPKFLGRGFSRFSGRTENSDARYPTGK